MNLISLKDVWLKYRVEFKEDGRIIPEDFWAVKEVNIDIDRGEVVGILGENGAGKTTILEIIAGMLRPDKGMVKINGSVSALLEIGAGFQKDLTGKENIYHISSLFGLTQKEIDARYNDIVNFAAIGRFINAPVRIYSQGMYMRLAFAIAIHVDPDILLIDDTFAVGDIYAQRKCINKIFELKQQGKTIIFVTQDIEMLKRLCTRGIFIREGAIIKEGPIDKLCSYYEESVGEKKGIAIMQKGLLGIIFNNGKLVLRWNDKTITSHFSGHSAILSSGREYISLKADWQVQESRIGEEIIATGKWPDLPVNQYWKIAFLNEREFIWDVTIDISEEIPVESFRTLVIFTNEYRSWFTLETKTDFPETFIHSSKWECSIVNDSLDRVIGLRGNNKTIESLPTIIFDRMHDNTNTICQVGNTGSEANGRAMVCKTFPGNSKNNYIRGRYRCFSGRVKIFDSKEDKELKLYLDNTKRVIREATIIRKDSFSLFCKERNIEIYWRDKLLTRGIGLNTKFRCQDRNYSAMDGQWVIRKENNEEIVITISWGGKFPFNQIWRLKLQGDDVILWEVEMEIDEEIKIRSKETELVLSGEYKKWIATEERGDFEKLEKKGIVVLNKYVNKHIGVESVDAIDDSDLPGILFYSEDTIPKTSYISKIKTDILITRLRYHEIDLQEHLYTLPGRYTYFRGEIRIITNREEADLVNAVDKKAAILRRDVKLLNTIGFNRTLLVFEHGKGKLFWKGNELTKGLGLYSSIFFEGIWYDSSHAFWEVRELHKERLVAIGRWPWVPLTQIWEIRLLNERTILWRIIRETWEDVFLEREQVNLMLSDRYKEWFVHRKVHGKFPERFSDHSGRLWDRLWCGDGASPIGIKKCKIKRGIFNSQLFPSVVFDCSSDCQIRYSVIENTDNLFQARNLQCELDTNHLDNSFNNKDKYFEGRIKITA